MLAEWGYQLGQDNDLLLPLVACQLFLLNRSPHAEDLSTELFDRVRGDGLLNGAQLNCLYALQRAVAVLGFCDPPRHLIGGHSAKATGGAPEWEQWVDRWHATSTLTARTRRNVRSRLLKVGRWLAAEQPEAADPAAWTRQTCAAWVAALDRMVVGDYVQRTAGLKDRVGKPLEAGSKEGLLSAVRGFFADCQEWEWLPRRFDPLRALATPRTITALLGPDPRVIADEVWAKLLWAGLNLEQGDLPVTNAGHFYPLGLVRAVTLTWLFGGLRSDEIARLRLGCVRWQHDGTAIPGDSSQILARDAVCLLDVPTNKTGTAFTKPVDPILGHALDAWQALRPSQPHLVDRRTGEQIDPLFAIRARRVCTHYINNTVIPMLCRKAGVPAADIRGNITSHQARSTIASQLYNAKEPMTLFELQAWLGHRSPSPPSTKPRSPRTPWPRHTATPATSPATSAPSKSSSTATRSPPARPPTVSPGSTTTSGTGTAPIPSSSSVHIGWPAPAATSTPPKTPARASSWRPRTTCSGCSPTFHSPRTNAPRSMTGRLPLATFWSASPTSRPRTGPRLGKLASQRPQPCCPSSRSTRANGNQLDKSDSTE